MAEDEVEEKRYSVVFEGDPKVYRYVAKDGPAKAEWENGDLYIGEYKNGKRNGKGLYKFAQGGLYKGDWVDNLKHGVGEFEAPDKGKYAGEWRDNQRHGQGTYEYPNGDSYKGGWEAGLKHGAGSYFYKSTGSTASGRWVKGQLLHGSWLMSDGSKYVGTFANNLPSGEGLLVFANGVTQSGRFEDGRWVAEEAFAPAHAVEAAPVDTAKQALRNLDKAVLKQDQIEVKLPKDVDGAPNLRQSAEFPVFGTGQPSAVGIEGVLEKIQKAGMDKVLWVNLRKEPVIYVNDNPYTARDKRHLGDNLSFAGLSREQLTQLEDKLIERLRVDCKRANGHLSVYAGDHAHLDEVKQLEKIRSVGKVFEALKTEQDFQVDFHKQPFQGDGAPTVEDFDRTVDLIKDLDANHAIVFNDQTGGEQTTIGMVIASLIRKALDHEEKEEEVEPVEPEIVEEEVEVSDDEAWADLDDDDVETKRAEKRKGKFDKLVAERQARIEKKKKEAEQDADDEERDLKQGQYLCVMKLVRQLQKKGPQLKADVDDVIEKNKHIVHIRDAILQAKEAHDQGDGAKKAAAKAAGARGLHTYFHLILFYVYLKESKKKETPFAVSFSKWLADHASWTALLTAGEFNWN